MGKCLLNELVHDESHESFEHNLSRALQGEEDKNIELRLKTMGQKEQESVFIVTNAFSCKDNIGNVVGVCFVGQDVTEVRVIMDMFVHLQEDYKAITESINPPIFVADDRMHGALNGMHQWRS
ncbi:Phytochrome [Thalictrum thalictroides]|uniref:Phytochrome n=1 Tax=Thalictrum thalictroides TaxID=46969 RepID=A0A7J6W9K8_THATH|nr:Phytochrome [Thalictrum thalictroides]